MVGRKPRIFYGDLRHLGLWYFVVHKGWDIKIFERLVCTTQALPISKRRGGCRASTGAARLSTSVDIVKPRVSFHKRSCGVLFGLRQSQVRVCQDSLPILRSRIPSPLFLPHPWVLPLLPCQEAWGMGRMGAAGACAGCPSPPGRLQHPQDADLVSLRLRMRRRGWRG